MIFKIRARVSQPEKGLADLKRAKLTGNGYKYKKNSNILPKEHTKHVSGHTFLFQVKSEIPALLVELEADQLADMY